MQNFFFFYFLQSGELRNISQCLLDILRPISALLDGARIIEHEVPAPNAKLASLTLPRLHAGILTPKLNHPPDGSPGLGRKPVVILELHGI